MGKIRMEGVGDTVGGMDVKQWGNELNLYIREVSADLVRHMVL